jgi:hypothetical protein
MTKSLPIVMLPKTIQDAIKVTRKLGIQFLWIDALCIIQDSRIDKSKEINSMGQIYKNATLTIAAAVPDCVYKGFLDLKADAIRLPFYLPNGSFTETTLIETYPDENKYRERFCAPLRTRAWALQEFLLSPRTLSFDKEDVFWHCQSVDHKPLCWDFTPFYSPLSSVPGGIFHCPSRLTDKDCNQLDIWSTISFEYSGRQLTLAEDRLSAIAGIAGELQQVWKDDYLAGMWKSCLIQQLCRYVDYSDSNDTQRQRSTTYLAPTWSWLSVDCHIWSSMMTRPEATLIDCTVSPIDPNSPRGRLQGGLLVLYAKLLHVTKELETSIQRFDYSSDEVEFGKRLYLRVGEVYGGDTEGLILMHISDSTFQRIGHFQLFHGKDYIWDSVEPKIVTII